MLTVHYFYGCNKRNPYQIALYLLVVPLFNRLPIILSIPIYLNKLLFGLCCYMGLYALSFAQIAPTATAALPHRLEWHSTSADDSLTIVHLIAPKTQYKDTSDCNIALQRLVAQLQQNGYLGVSIDSFWRNNQYTRIVIFIGQRYETADIDIKGIDKRALQQSGVDALLRKGSPLRPTDIWQIQSRLLQYAENNGYPFAQTRWQNVHFDNNNRFYADLDCQLNKTYRLDTLKIEGAVRISRRYLWRYLHLLPNALYSESDIKQISTRLRELPFLQEIHPPTVGFDIANKAQVVLFLKPKKASRFDFLLGILPNANTATAGNNTKRYQISGEGLLDLHNALGGGEMLNLQFKNYPNNIKELKTRISYPYLPLLPIGGDAKFELYLRDTLFRNIQSYLGVQYLLRGNNYWKGYVQWLASDILSIDSAHVSISKKLPAILDTRTVLYGIEYNFERLDYRLNPRRGMSLYINIGIGTKQFKRNPQIISLGEAIETNFLAQYDSLNQQGVVGQVAARVANFWALGKHSTLHTALHLAWKPPNITLLNETYRIGGSKLLRGFNEESILATFYGISTLEFRYLLGQNAFAFAFCDMAYTENRSRSSLAPINRPLSFGLGTTFETKAGIFGLTYALGKEQGNPFDMRAGKIHLAYLNYF